MDVLAALFEEVLDMYSNPKPGESHEYQRALSDVLDIINGYKHTETEEKTSRFSG